jgi:hypothetical protein
MIVSDHAGAGVGRGSLTGSIEQEGPAVYEHIRINF